jgi:FkbM family methyltransferase
MSTSHFVKRVVRTALGFDLFISPEVDLEHIVLGTVYGGWPIIPALTKRDSVVYSFGVGEDVSFDLAIINKFGCHVHAFDPTPKSIQWVSQQNLPQEFEFHPLGIGAKNGELTFYPPVDPKHVSFTIKRHARSRGEPTKAPVNDLETIMCQLGHAHIDILKMDVEGAEFDVVRGFAHQRVRPAQFMVEFHHGMYGYKASETHAAVAELRRLGYRLYYRSEAGHEFAFVDASRFHRDL